MQCFRFLLKILNTPRPRCLLEVFNPAYVILDWLIVFAHGSLLFALDCSGGAERLAVDAAVELSSLGHHVHIFTAHHDKKRCFEETIDGDSPLLLSYLDVWEPVVKLSNSVYVGLQITVFQ